MVRVLNFVTWRSLFGLDEFMVFGSFCDYAEVFDLNERVSLILLVALFLDDYRCGRSEIDFYVK